MRGTTGQEFEEVREADISIHVPREGDDSRCRHRHRPVRPISIHVPREGDDSGFGFQLLHVRAISIHVPREGDDAQDLIAWWQDEYFNPRPP